MNILIVTQNDIKHCNKCGRNLPYEAFNRDSRKRDGYRTTCRECGKNVPSKLKPKPLSIEKHEQKKEYMRVRRRIRKAKTLYIRDEPATDPIEGYQEIECPKDCGDCELTCQNDCSRFVAHVCVGCPCLESKEVIEYMYEMNQRRRVS